MFLFSGESDVNLIDFDENSLRQKLTDRQHGNDFIGEVEDSRKKLEQYIKAVDREITKRRQVKDLLEQARKYYDSLHEEANIVANVSCDYLLCLFVFQTTYCQFGDGVSNKWVRIS